jgi:DNA-binding NarL/FixJ family response regulator
MARVLALTADLLFGSRVQADLAAAGHDVRLVAGERELRELLAERAEPAEPTEPAEARRSGRALEVLLVDLTDAALDAAAIYSRLKAQLADVRTLGYYSHVEPVARERALEAGIELVVPRSRFAREGADLVAGLLSGDAAVRDSR